MSVASDVGSLSDRRRPAPRGSSVALRVAWVVTVLVSTVPVIVLTELTGSAPGWVAGAQLALAAAIVVASIVVPALRPLRGFGLVLSVLLLGSQAVRHVDLTSRPVQELFGATLFDERMQSEQATKLGFAVLMVAVLLLLGYRRRDFFLARGELGAPIRPVRALGFPHADPWWRFGLQWGLYIAAGLAVVLYLSQRPSGQEFSAMLPMLPSILFYAAVNAVNEEMTYRAPLLATLEPVVGSTQAVWMAALVFGSAHYYGRGLLAAALSVLMGWLLGKAMVETRGLFWAWWIHFLSDVVIFTFLAMALV